MSSVQPELSVLTTPTIRFVNKVRDLDGCITLTPWGHVRQHYGSQQNSGEQFRSSRLPHELR